MLAIASTDDAAVVGNVNLVRFSEDAREAAIGYWTIPEARRRGFARAAVRALSNWAFDDFGVEQIEFSIAPHNHASIALARTVGAHEAGTRMAQPNGLKPPIELLQFMLVPADLADG